MKNLQTRLLVKISDVKINKEKTEQNWDLSGQVYCVSDVYRSIEQQE